MLCYLWIISSIYQFRSHKRAFFALFGMLADVVWKEKQFQYCKDDNQLHNND